MLLEMADIDGVSARAPKGLADPTPTHPTSFHSPISPLVHKLQGALQNRASPWCCTWENERCLRPGGGETALWADAQPSGTPGRSSHALTAPARRHLLMLQQVFEVNHLHNDLDVLLGSRAEVMLQVALPL